MSNGSGKQHPAGSPEDLKLTLEILQKFVAEKLKAVDLHASGKAASGTSPTWSVCNADGTTDGDS